MSECVRTRPFTRLLALVIEAFTAQMPTCASANGAEVHLRAKKKKCL